MLEISTVPESNTATTGNRENDEGGGSVSVGSGEEERVGGGAEEGGDRSFGGNRWPRQETLAMLKIRSDMDDAFRDASSKAPLWEQVSRSVGHSLTRSLFFFFFFIFTLLVFSYSLFDSWEILKALGYASI